MNILRNTVISLSSITFLVISNSVFAWSTVQDPNTQQWTVKRGNKGQSNYVVIPVKNERAAKRLEKKLDRIDTEDNEE